VKKILGIKNHICKKSSVKISGTTFILKILNCKKTPGAKNSRKIFNFDIS
jgi:hypothetical protein